MIQWYFLVRAFHAGTLLTVLEDSEEKAFKLAQEIKETINVEVSVKPIKLHAYVNSIAGCGKCYEIEDHPVHHDQSA